MKNVLDFKVGTTIIMDSSPDDVISLKCQGVKVFEGKVGCVDDDVAVAVTKVINKKMRENL